MKATVILSLVASIAAFVGGMLSASEEEFLEWSEVRIVSPERKDTGKVVFSAKTVGEKYGEVRIEAFGKTYVLERDQLEKLTGFPLSSLRTSHEAGYERLGGHMVHFKMNRVRYDRDTRLVEDRVVLSVSRGQGLKISGPELRVLKEKSE